MLFKHEDIDIIATFFLHFYYWYGGDRGWQPHYFLTDDSIAEQQIVSLTFKDLIGDNFVEYFLCHTHFEHTLTRNLATV